MPAVQVPKVSVLIAGDGGPNTASVRQWLQGHVDDLHVEVIPDLCNRPAEICRILAESGATRLVIGLGGSKCEYPTSQVQAQARRSGLDPLGIEVVHLGSSDAPLVRERVGIQLAAAIARTRAFTGSLPQNARPLFSAVVSRGRLRLWNLLEHRSIPSVLGNRCASGLGCADCAVACPQGAMRLAGGVMALDTSRCNGCGICITSCPRGAVVDPTVTPDQLEAQVRSLLDPSIGTLWPRGILFTCGHEGPGIPGLAESAHPSWFPVRVPCVDMIPAAWLLAPLVMGAGAVGALPGDNQYASGHGAAVSARIACCQDFLRQVGDWTDRVLLDPDVRLPVPESRLFPAPAGNGSIPTERTGNATVKGTRAFHHLSAASVLTALVQDRPAAKQGVTLNHPGSPLGVVEIQDDLCTGCGMCARVCPTGALRLEQSMESVALTMAADRCTACGHCLDACPEMHRGAIRVVRRIDLTLISQGRCQVYREETRRCADCNRPIAPVKMLGRIESLLGEEYEATNGDYLRYCPYCRTGRTVPV